MGRGQRRPPPRGHRRPALAGPGPGRPEGGRDRVHRAPRGSRHRARDRWDGQSSARRADHGGAGIGRGPPSRGHRPARHPWPWRRRRTSAGAAVRTTAPSWSPGPVHPVSAARRPAGPLPPSLAVCPSPAPPAPASRRRRPSCRRLCCGRLSCGRLAGPCCRRRLCWAADSPPVPAPQSGPARCPSPFDFDQAGGKAITDKLVAGLRTSSQQQHGCGNDEHDRCLSSR